MKHTMPMVLRSASGMKRRCETRSMLALPFLCRSLCRRRGRGGFDVHLQRLHNFAGVGRLADEAVGARVQDGFPDVAADLGAEGDDGEAREAQDPADVARGLHAVHHLCGAST